MPALGGLRCGSHLLELVEHTHVVTVLAALSAAAGH
jgi:hypothetical protein